jgi:hypothetical protein
MAGRRVRTRKPTRWTCPEWARRNNFSVILAASVVVVVFSSLKSTINAQENDADNKIADHYRRLGASYKATIGKSCPSCIRGMISSHDINPGEKVLEVPINLVHFLNGDKEDNTFEVMHFPCTSLRVGIKLKNVACL